MQCKEMHCSTGRCIAVHRPHWLHPRRLERLQRIVTKLQTEAGLCEEQLNQADALLQAVSAGCGAAMHGAARRGALLRGAVLHGAKLQRVGVRCVLQRGVMECSAAWCGAALCNASRCRAS